MEKRRSQQNQNQPSTLLNSEENATLFDLIGRRCVTLASAVVQVFFAEAPSYSHWTKRFCGVATYIRDSSKRSYFIRVFDLKRNSPLWEQEIYKAFDYKAQKPYFHSFDGENCPVGLNFANESEAALFQDAVIGVLARKKKKRNAAGAESVRRAAPPSPSNQPSNSMYSPSVQSPVTSPALTMPALPFAPGARTSVNGGGTLDRQSTKAKAGKKGSKKKLTTADIGTPSGFQHVQHLGWDHESSGTLDNILEQNPEVKNLFYQVGLSDAQLKDKNMEEFLMQFLDCHGGIDAVKRDVQTRPAPRPPPQVPAPAPPSQRSMDFQAPPMKLPPAPRMAAPTPPRPTSTSTSSRSSILDRSAMFEQPVASPSPPVPAPVVRPPSLAHSRSFDQGGPAMSARGQAPPVPPPMSVRGPRPPVPPPLSSRVPSVSEALERTPPSFSRQVIANGEPPALPAGRAMSQRSMRTSAEPPPVPPTAGYKNDSPSPSPVFPGKSQRAPASDPAASRAPAPTPIPELSVSPGGRKYGAPSSGREPAAPPPPLPTNAPPSARAPPPVSHSAPPVPPPSRGRYQQQPQQFVPEPEPEFEEPESYNDQQGWSRNGNDDYPQDEEQSNAGFAVASPPPPPGPPPPPPPGPPPPPMLGPPPGGASLTAGLDLQSVQLRQCPKETEQPSGGRNAHLAAIAKGIQLKPVSKDDSDRASGAVDDGDVGLASVLKRALDDRFQALAGGDDDDDDEPSDDEEWEDD